MKSKIIEILLLALSPALYLSTPAYKMGRKEYEKLKEKEREKKLNLEKEEKEFVKYFDITIKENFWGRRIITKEREKPLVDEEKINLIHKFLIYNNVDILGLK